MRNQELEDKVNTDVFLNDNTLKEKESIILQLKKSVHHQSIVRGGNIIYYGKFVLNSIKV